MQAITKGVGNIHQILLLYHDSGHSQSFASRLCIGALIAMSMTIIKQCLLKSSYYFASLYAKYGVNLRTATKRQKWDWVQD